MKKFTTLYNCEFSVVYTRREAAPKFRCDKFPKIKQCLKLKLKLGHRVTRKSPEQVLSKCLWNWAKRASVQFSSVQSLSRVRLFATPWIAARQASLSITISRSSLKLTSIESVMPSSHLILCHPLLLLPPIPPSIRVFSNESALHMRWPKY